MDESKGQHIAKVPSLHLFHNHRLLCVGMSMPTRMRVYLSGFILQALLQHFIFLHNLSLAMAEEGRRPDDSFESGMFQSIYTLLRNFYVRVHLLPLILAI